MAKTSHLPIGTISAGTQGAEDIIASLVGALRSLHLSKADRAAFRAMMRELDDTLDNDRMSRVLEDLTSLAENYTPPYTHIGMHYGDGADFGVWINHEDISNGEFSGGPCVSDLADVPRGYTGDVLHVNDHGNATLYRATRGRLIEVWSVV